MSEDGSEEAPSQPKRKLKRLLLSDTSSSDSDESVTPPPRIRRNRLRVISDGSDSGSGSSIVRIASRRRRLWPLPDSSSSESDSSGWLSDRPDAQQPEASTSKVASGSASDTSEGNSDKCSICLMRFTTQKVGTPQPCDHIFCLDCITEWSKNVNTCPVDRIKFDAIVVRSYAGGKVLRTDPVKVLERRPSVDIFEFENTTACEICHSTEDEETMLLCDGCDLGFHMQCLSPPLNQVPVDHWFCPNCDGREIGEDTYLMPQVDDLLTDILDVDFPSGYRALPLSRFTRTSRVRNIGQSNAGAPGDNAETQQGPSTSSASTTLSGSTRARATRRRATTSRRKYKRRRTKTVIVEYELKNGSKFPITRKVKRRVKKRKTRKRQPRTAARLSLVRASVRARLAAQTQGAAAGRGMRPSGLGTRPVARPVPLAAPPLRLFGNPNQLDYFSDDEGDASEAASAAVACRPTANILSAFRQARRKNMIAIPSPPHAASAPDLLADILESQTLLHSKNSVISVTLDGHVDVKLQSRRGNKSKMEDSKAEKIDLTKGCDAVKKVPSYPGQSRGGGGWGGGYRGNYHREQGANADNFTRGGNYEGGYGGGHRSRQGNAFNQNNARRDETDSYGDFPRRPHQYSHEDDNFDRHRRPPDLNRGSNYGNAQRNEMGRNSLAPSWQPYGGSGPSASRREARPRHSFGGFENPLDMRVGQASARCMANDDPVNLYVGADSVRRDETPSQAFRPLPEPPLFKFDGGREVERSEEEKSDDGLIIDTEKYDPTEPTNDDESGDDDRTPSLPVPSLPAPPLPPPVLSSPPALPPPPAPPAIVQDIIAGIDTATINVPPNVLDTAVRQVLREHRNLIAPPAEYDNDKSDQESDGDCPNFSIYSATSVHIANSSESALTSQVQKETSDDNLEDLVQEDDDVTAPETPAPSTENLMKPALDSNHKRKMEKEEEYKEKVSKRCPITPNTRNPIKIKLNTPSLIKRHVSLYDEEDDIGDETVTLDKTESTENTKAIVKESQHTPDESSERKTPPDDVEAPKQFVKSHFEEVESLKDENKPLEEDRESSCDEKGHNSVPQSSPGDNEIFKTEEVDTIGNDDKLLKNEDETIAEKSETEEDHEHEMEHREPHSEDNVDISDNEVDLNSQCSKKESTGRNEDVLEKMTESISETEDERSYTPCLDENKEKGIEGLDTEMISEEEGNEIFSDNEKATPSRSRTSPAPPAPAVPDGEEGEILDKNKRTEERDDAKKKKKKESKKDSRDKKKNKGQKGEVAFKKLSRSGKERNYREREKEEKSKSKKDRRDSSDANDKEKRREQKRKEKRKDLARYDVRTVVSEKRKKQKDPFGRDISPPSPSRSPRGSSRERTSPSLSRARKSSTPLRTSPALRRSPTPRRRPRSGTPPSRGVSPPARRLRPSPTPPSSPEVASRSRKRRISSSPRRRSRLRRSPSPRRRVSPRRRRSVSRGKKRPRRSVSKSPKPKAAKKKKRSRSERPASRARRRGSPRRKSPKRKKTKRRSVSPVAARPEPASGAWSPLSVDSRLASPRTPPADLSPQPLHALLAGDSRRRKEKRRRPERPRHRRNKDLGGSKEVFTSGNNILVSVSFNKDQERDGDADGDAQRRRRERRERRRRRRKTVAASELESAKPVAIIDLERSPFRELTPSPKNVIVLSDDDRGAPETVERPAAAPAQPEPAHEPPQQFSTTAVGPKTPPEPSAQPQVKFTIATKPACPPRAANPLEGEEGAVSADGAATPADPPSSPDAYDPFEPTRSASASPARPPSPDRPTMTLEAAQKTNLSADEVLDRRPLSPMEKVMALLQSQRDVSPEPLPMQAPPPAETGAEAAATVPQPTTPAPAAIAPCAAAQRIVLPSPTRPQPKLFLAKPSPIKSNPVKPMQATKISKLPLPVHGESPYSPGSSDFGDLFEPPPAAPRQRRAEGFDSLFDAKPRSRRDRSNATSVAKVPVKLNRKKGKTQVGIKIDDDSLKILDELPSSAVEMQVKSKFLKKLNRQERVVEEVKLVLKPHYNKKHVTKDEYKDILRRAVPKICHNKTGEINPPKIQTLVEAYVKKYRKKHKLGLL